MGDEKTVTGIEVPPAVVSATPENPPARATTTSEEDLHSKNQRRVNLVWEFTQSFIATTVVGTSLFAAIRLTFAVLNPAVSEKTAALAITAFLLLSNLASLVIGFYFGRTNHQNVGGVQLGR